MKNAYKKLYFSLKAIEKQKNIKEHVVFTAMKGHKYESSKTVSGEEFRLMLVGRAVNGWDEYRDKGNDTEDGFIKDCLCNLDNCSEAVLSGKDRFEWILTNGDSATNCPRIGIDRDPQSIIDDPYPLGGSPLWNYTKTIWENIFGECQLWGQRWFENIVWTNLYKIAPHNGGNPSNKIMKMQLEACAELLKKEIEYFNPTHILFLTGRDWANPFISLFDNVRLRKANQSRGENKNEIYVEGTALYNTLKGGKCRVVIACRPEFRNKDKFTTQVTEYLTEKKNIEDYEIC